MKSKFIAILFMMITTLAIAGVDRNGMYQFNNHKCDAQVKTCMYHTTNSINLMLYTDIPRDIPPYLVGGGVICLVLAASFTDQRDMLSPIGVTPPGIPNSSKWLIGIGSSMLLAGFVLQIDF